MQAWGMNWSPAARALRHHDILLSSTGICSNPDCSTSAPLRHAGWPKAESSQARCARPAHLDEIWGGVSSQSLQGSHDGCALVVHVAGVPRDDTADSIPWQHQGRCERPSVLVQRHGQGALMNPRSLSCNQRCPLLGLGRLWRARLRVIRVDSAGLAQHWAGSA